MVSRRQREIDTRETSDFAELVLVALIRAGIPMATFRHGFVRKDGAGIIITRHPSTRLILIEPKYPASIGDTGDQGWRLVELCLPVVRGLLLPVLAGKAYAHVWPNKDRSMPAAVVKVPQRDLLERLLARHQQLGKRRPSP